MSAPIIFCHYSNSNYLPYVFELSRLTNPDKNIFLLGDQENKSTAIKKGIDHNYFLDYSYGPEIEIFEKVYQLVKGKKYYNLRVGKDWVNFVFKRWFYIYNFLLSKQINDFWFFDTDTMILDSLTDHEGKFQPYDCTEQCNSKCMKGYFSNPDIILKYIIKINELFQNESFLERQQQEFDDKSDTFAFTEMRAYQEFKKDGIKSIRLNSIIDDSSFDDAICQNHDMEMEDLPFRKPIKTIYCSPDGRFYCKYLVNKKFIKMNSLNLSWVPLDLFKIILSKVQHKSEEKRNSENEISQMPTLSELYQKKYFYKIYYTKLKSLMKLKISK